VVGGKKKNVEARWQCVKFGGKKWPQWKLSRP